MQARDAKETIQDLDAFEKFYRKEIVPGLSGKDLKASTKEQLEGFKGSHLGLSGM